MRQLDKLADRFEQKLLKYADDLKTEQQGTSELFFGSAENQETFTKEIMNDKSPAYQLLYKYYMQGGKPCSFSLDASAEPKVGAKWVLTVSPESLKTPVYSVLNNMFTKIIKKPMSQKQTEADAAAKQGFGSGQNHIANIEMKEE